MRLALDRGPDLARLAALGYFAGIRTAELMRLGEEDINVGRGLVFVPAAKAKTRSRRLIVIQPNLAAWLRLEGRLPVSDGMRRLRAWRGACRRAGVPWPHNVARHSFVSYHLAAFGNAAKTALEAGHSEAMLFAHYRELVTPDAAEAFWGISPDPVP
jgi:integrase